jgi:UPF0148 protein
MNEEEKLKRITELLEKGCTMLASHHDCGAPLFRCKGEIVCPVCSSGSGEFSDTPIRETDAVESLDNDEAIAPGGIKAENEGALPLSSEPPQVLDQEHRKGDQLRPGQTNLKSGRLAQNLVESSRDSEFEIIKQSVRRAILLRLKNIALDIKSERDPCRLRAQLECVDAALRVINALK